MLEKADSVGGFARTEKANGKEYDMSTMFVPGGSIAGDGIEPTLQEMIDVSKEKMSPAIGFYTLDTEDQYLDLIPEPLQEYSPEEIISQVLTGLGYSTELLLCRLDPAYCASCEVCASASEPLAQWGETWGVPAYAKLCLHAFDGLGAAPSVFIVTFSSTLSAFASVDAAELLRNLGVTADSLPPSTLPNIVSLLSSTRWYFFDRGYQTFWEELVERANILVVTGVSVEALELTSDGVWQLTGSDGNEYIFDQVIVTTAPQDALSFVPSDQASLLATAVPQVPPNDVFIVEAADGNPADTDVDNEIVAFWPTGFGLGTPSLIDPSQGGLVKPFFYQRRHARGIFVVGTLTLSGSIEEAFETTKIYSKDVLGLELSDDYLHHERYYFPSGPSDKTSWANGWASLQGKDGLWFNGESFAGSGIPVITQYTKQFIDATFPEV